MVLLLAWLTLFPVLGFFPQISHILAMLKLLQRTLMLSQVAVLCKWVRGKGYWVNGEARGAVYANAGRHGTAGDGGLKARGAIRRMALGLELSIEIEPTRMSKP